MRRREFITLLGGATAWSLAASAQQTALPVIGFINGGGRDAATHAAAAFSKRLALLHELVPKAARIAVLVNPANAPTSETAWREAQEAARTLGLQIHVVNASTTGEIDAAFATLGRERADALLIAGDGFFNSRRS